MAARYWSGIMKLYLWKEFQFQYTSGLAFAIAESEDEAIKLVKAEFIKTEYSEPWNWGPLTVHDVDSPIAACCNGGD